MTKKRRTRAQKTRAATRRPAFASVTPQITEKTLEQTITIQPLQKPVINRKPRNNTVAGQNTPHLKQDLRLSLNLLWLILLVQGGLWLVFHISNIDQHLYDWLKL